MKIFELSSFPIEQITSADQFAENLGAWFSERPWPVRLLAYNRPCNLQNARSRIYNETRRLGTQIDTWMPLVANTSQNDVSMLQLLPEDAFAQLCQLVEYHPTLVNQLTRARAGDAVEPLLGQQLQQAIRNAAWKLPWLRDAALFLEALEQRHLRSARYLLLTWEPDDHGVDGLLPTIRRAFQRPATVLERMPEIITSSYLEQSSVLCPERVGAPYLACLLSYDMRGEIDIDVLHPLMARPYDLALAIDIQTRPQSRTLAHSERAYMTARAAASDWRQKDARAERQLADAEQALHELVHQNLHDVSIAILLAGDTREDLEAHVADVRDLLGSRLKLMRPRGVQAELLKLWTSANARAIDIPWKRRNLYSQGLGCLAAVMTYHRAAANTGLLWGIDGQRLAPLMLDLFADRKAAHMVVLGKTGYGKTFFLNTMALRAAALGGYRVVMVDAFENARRMQRAAGAGVNASWLSLDTAINILDIVFNDDGWLAAQIEHVISQLGLLMGRVGHGPDASKVLLPRVFTPEERGVLDRGLALVYARCSPETALADTPLLSDLVDALDTLHEPEASALADALSAMLRGSRNRSAALNAFGRRFNAPTAISWDFSSPINCYDMGAISLRAPEWLPFYYAQVIGSINRYMRDPQRDRSVPTLLIIDEYGYAAQVESVARMAADICKVARKYGLGLLVVDQSPHTFQTPTGKDILDNAPARILFHLDSEPARLAGELIGDLTAAHIDFLSQAERGEAVAVFDNDVHVLLVETSAQEQRAFRGS